ncbi:uncharacterized protein DFL_005563 [Arthrobotrys flagrans]|uniref:Uncharacterized protein n=1 Tax=Arthrobotrys flagrans TaxID=97331 RepID=A0A436ZYG7_ARTFL|nr:hypothetical protein DFL_005563 [Arthrobotrys flagrans]
MERSPSPGPSLNNAPQILNPDAIPFDKYMPWHLFWRDAILRSIKPDDYDYLEDPGFNTDLSRYTNYQYTTSSVRLPWADEKEQVLQSVRPEWKNLFQYFEQAGGHDLQIPENTPKLLKMAYMYGYLERKAWSQSRDLQGQRNLPTET